MVEELFQSVEGFAVAGSWELYRRTSQPAKFIETAGRPAKFTEQDTVKKGRQTAVELE